MGLVLEPLLVFARLDSRLGSAPNTSTELNSAVYQHLDYLFELFSHVLKAACLLHYAGTEKDN